MTTDWVFSIFNYLNILCMIARMLEFWKAELLPQCPTCSIAEPIRYSTQFLSRGNLHTVMQLEVDFSKAVRIELFAVQVLCGVFKYSLEYPLVY